MSSPTRQPAPSAASDSISAPLAPDTTGAPVVSDRLFDLPDTSTPEAFRASRKQPGRFIPFARAVCQRHGLVTRAGSRDQDPELTYIEDAGNIVFRVDDSHYLKLFAPPFEDEYLIEQQVLDLLHRHPYPGSIAIPRIAGAGRQDGWTYLLVTAVPGITLHQVWDQVTPEDRVSLCRELTDFIAHVHSLPVPRSPELAIDWSGFMTRQIAGCVAMHRSRGLGEPWVSRVADYIAAHHHRIPLHPEREVLVCADYHQFNTLVEKTGDTWRIASIIDFADAVVGDPEYDVAAPAILIARGHRDALHALLTGLGYSPDSFSSDLKHRLMTHVLLHKYSDLSWYLAMFEIGDDCTMDQLIDILWPL